MAVLPIYLYPHKVLSQKAQIVDEITKEIITLLDNMSETLLRVKGVGLAANQVGILQRVLVINGDVCSNKDDDDYIPKGIIRMVNPEIVWKNEDEICVQEEGCYSIPNVFADVERFASVEVKFLDENGKEHTIKTKSGLFNAAVQHEIDHLDGILFPERLSRTKRNMIKKKYFKIKQDIENQIVYEYVI